MNSATQSLLTITLMLGLLAGCAHHGSGIGEMSMADQNARTKADHEALASHYDQMTKDAEAKVIEEQKLLEQYQAHGYLYGREAEDLEEHTEALIRSSQQVADTSAKMAKMQRELAKAMKQ